MMNTKGQESGQAIYLIVLGLVAMMGVTALSIDGGRLYADRRRAQNAADSAAFAAAFAIVEEGDPSLEDAAAQNTGLSIAASNGYNNDGSSNTVTIHHPPADGSYAGDDEYVQVKVWAQSTTSLIQFVYQGPTEVQAEAVVRVLDTGSDVLGNAIVTLGDCSSGTVIQINGGGHTGGVLAYNGGIFINASDDDTCCALSPGSSSNNLGITSDTSITSVGTCDYDGESKISPVPIETGFNGGKSVTDPLAHLPEPQCTADGYKVGNTLYPGYYNKGNVFSGDITLEPGIYCIDDAIKFTGHESMEGDGVVLYFTDKGSITCVGNGGFSISAPNDSNCLGTEGDPTASCTYKGIAIFAARDNTRDFDIRGNGNQAIDGLFYGINVRAVAKGGGHTADDTIINGQLIVKQILGTGNGYFSVTYNNNLTYGSPAMIELTK